MPEGASVTIYATDEGCGDHCPAVVKQIAGILYTDNRPDGGRLMTELLKRITIDDWWPGAERPSLSVPDHDHAPSAELARALRCADVACRVWAPRAIGGEFAEPVTPSRDLHPRLGGGVRLHDNVERDYEPAPLGMRVWAREAWRGEPVIDEETAARAYSTLIHDPRAKWAAFSAKWAAALAQYIRACPEWGMGMTAPMPALMAASMARAVGARDELVDLFLSLAAE